MKEYFDKLQPYLESGMAFQSAITLFQWDLETQAPKLCEQNTSKVMGILSDGYFRSYMNPEVTQILKKMEHCKKLNQKEKGILRELQKIQRQLSNIPANEYKTYSELLATATNVWAKAKEKNDYTAFVPTLEKIIDYKRRFVRYRGEKEKGIYNSLLHDYEIGFGEKELDTFFDNIKRELIPFVKKIMDKKSVLNKKYKEKAETTDQNKTETEKSISGEYDYDIEKQREFCKELASYIGFDCNKGIIAESAHPFTTAIHNHDVRITNHYDKKYPESAIFSIIHETGHALYEMNIKDEYTQTLLGEGTSMGMHESQSRFWENMVGRSKAFWKPLFPKLKTLFSEELQDVTLDDFIREINQVNTSFIRTESDELTYSLHIIIRYEIEKEIFHNEKLAIKDLEKIWNEKYKEYLGITPSNASEGILQDIHWACGDFGYFPSYAIGTAIAAQIYAHMKTVMPIEDYLESGNLIPIREYLKEHVHQFGKAKTTNEILYDMMKEGFNPDYYIKYLKEKYSKLYSIK